MKGRLKMNNEKDIKKADKLVKVVEERTKLLDEIKLLLNTDKTNSNFNKIKNIFTPILGEILTEEQKEAINNYKSVSDELNNWKEKFGNKTPSEVFNSQGFSLTPEQEYKLKTYDSLLAERSQYKKERERLIKDKHLTRNASNTSHLANEIQKKIEAAYHSILWPL